MGHERTLEDVLEEALVSKNTERQELARKVKDNLLNGITPGARELKRLYSSFAVLNPCTRLNDRGSCDGWLRKYGAESGVPAEAPFICPFASSTTQKSRFNECPGYRGT